MPKSKMDTRPINDDRIVAKLPGSTKSKFYELCYSRGLIPSMVLRNLIDAYIAGRPALPADRKPVSPTPTRKGKA